MGNGSNSDYKKWNDYAGWLNPYSLLLLAAAFLFAASVNQLSADNDTDILWHYKIGEQILETHEITLKNTFTWIEGSTWNQQEWLFDVILYFWVHTFGLAGYVVMNTIGMFFGLLICLHVSHTGQPVLFLFAFLVLHFCVRMCGRPGEYSVYFIVFFISLYGSEICRWRKLLYMALIGLFMANFHGGNICAMLCMYGVMLLTDFVLDQRDHSLKGKLYLLHLEELAVFAAASCICPMGPGILVNSILAAGSKTIPYIAEWMPYRMHFLEALLFVFGILSLGYFLGQSHFERNSTRNIALIAAFTVLTFISYRNRVILLHLWLCFGAGLSMDMVYQLFRAKEEIIHFPGERIKKQIAIPTVMTVFVASILFTVWRIGKYRTFSSYGDRYCSPQILEILEREKGENVRILAPYVLSNSLLFHDIPVSFDSREYPYDTKNITILLEDFKTGEEDLSYSTDFVKKYDFDYVWTDKRTYRIELSMERNENYEKVYEDLAEEQVLWKRKSAHT